MSKPKVNDLQHKLAVDKYYHTVSGLLTRALEAFTIWWYIQNRFANYDDDPATMMHSEFLAMIGYSCRRTAVVTLAAITDSKTKEINFTTLFDEIERRALLDVEPMRNSFKQLNRPITKIRIVRNNVDAHIPDDQVWRLSKSYGSLHYPEVRSLMMALFRILKQCATQLDLGYDRFTQVERFTRHYCEQMMKGFQVQHKTGKITFLD